MSKRKEEEREGAEKIAPIAGGIANASRERLRESECEGNRWNKYAWL
jgi:hypothetical protein